MNEHGRRHTLAARRLSAAWRLRNPQRGLALLDVLLGMVIFSLIVVISLQSAGQLRQRAFQTSASSDVQQVSLGLEGHFTDAGYYPGDLASAKTALAAQGINFSKGSELAAYARNDSAYQACVVHKTGGSAASNIDAWTIYDSTTGAIAGTGRGAGSAPAFCTGGAASYAGFVPTALVTATATPTPTPTPTPVGPINISDTFSSTGALGTTEVGAKTWEFFNSVSADWTRVSGNARTTAASSGQPMAVVDTGKSDFQAVMEAVGGGPGTGIYFRVIDANDWLLADIATTTTTTTRQITEEEWYFDCTNVGGTIHYSWFESPAAVGSSCQQYYRTGNYRPGTATSTSTTYTLRIDRSINGVIDTLATTSLGSSAPAFVSLTAKGSAITVKYGSSASTINSTGPSATVTTHATGTRVGIGLFSGSSGQQTRIGDFTLTDAP